MSGFVPIRVPIREKDRKPGDPGSLKRENTKSHHMRKGKHDPGLTPTEARRKNVLMRQFMSNPEGSTNSEAYRNSAVWCSYPGCGKMNGSHEH